MFEFLVAVVCLGLIQNSVRAGAIEHTSLKGDVFDLNKPNVELKLKGQDVRTLVASEQQSLAATKPGIHDDCPSMDDLIGMGGRLLVNTTNIVTETVHVFYVVLFRNTDCKTINGFRCFLRKFHEFGINIVDVGEKLTYYKKNTNRVLEIFRDYFGRCRQT